MARLFALLTIVLFTTSIQVGADAEIGEWVGVYAMNHDGFEGTLRIDDTGRQCARPAWCHLAISYVDADKMRRGAAILTVDQAGQHMAFVIAFPGTRQRFDAYLMSWDKTRMAGTTVWQGRTFGFYAVKQQDAPPASPADRPAAVLGRARLPARGMTAVTPTPAPGGPGAQSESQATINANGQVETTLPDGRKELRRPGQCGWTTVWPDGKTSTTACNQVQPATPPIPQGASAQWLDAHSTTLLDIIRSLLAGDQASIDNYLRTSEPPTLGVYDRIRIRTSLIGLLTGPA